MKKTKLKLTWLADIGDLVPLRLVDFDHLISKKKLEEGDDITDFVTPVSVSQTSSRMPHLRFQEFPASRGHRL